MAVQVWVDLIHKYGAAPTPAESEAFEQNAWIAGQCGMSLFASWSTPTQYKFANYAWDVAPWPAGPAGQSCGSFGSGFSITKNSGNAPASWRFLSSYLSKEGMEFMWGSSGRGSPARAEAYQSWLDSEPASDSAHYFLHALENYAVTGRPYQTLAAPQLLDITGRYQTLCGVAKSTWIPPSPASLRKPTWSSRKQRSACPSSLLRGHCGGAIRRSVPCVWHPCDRHGRQRRCTPAQAGANPAEARGTRLLVRDRALVHWPAPVHRRSRHRVAGFQLYGLDRTQSSGFIGLENYRVLLAEDLVFWETVYNTFYYTFGSVLLGTWAPCSWRCS